ncbi:MAG: hypothetical protein A2X02_02470 [Bacteroidetes bacterium GWF2_29_10]|nr:MAG: hypothetical protein A2X02_02470 [Bacteroidetes bacterium GWF2_29_10]
MRTKLFITIFAFVIAFMSNIAKGQVYNECIGDTVYFISDRVIDGTVQWQDSSGGVWTDILGATSSTYSFVASTNRYLRAKVIERGCNPKYSTIKTIIANSPILANAGPDKSDIVGFATLDASIPAIGSGIWHILNGVGGSLTDSTKHNTGFSGMSDSTYQLTWTISNACGISIDTVNISFSNININIEMVFVEGGTFTMGCTAEQEPDCYNNEKPTSQVTLSSFYIGKYEVTQKQWRDVMGNNPSYFNSCGDNCPVEQISWNDIQGFITKLNQLTGKTYRLPTEAEWEYASRGGNKSKGYKYSGSNDIDMVAWYSSNSGNKTHPVGQKLPNELGIYDMSGNLWEWVNDWYGNYTSDAKTNPTGPVSGIGRILRGGSWISGAQGCRSAGRSSNGLFIRGYGSGLRLVSSSN